MSILIDINNMLSPYAFAAAIVLFIFCLVLMIILINVSVKQKKLQERMEFFMRDAKGDSLEGVLRSVLEDNQKVKLQLKNDVEEILKINENLVTAYRKMGVVKYNAFPGMAGKISACICLLNNENNGIIINAIHGQDGCYTYVKEIMNGKSINPLTKEDEEALKIALQVEI